MNSTLAQQLWQARQTGTLANAQDYPDSIESAYQWQKDVTKASGCVVCGFKIGATVKPLMQKLGLEEPFAGPLFPRYCGTNGSVIKVSPDQCPMVETELVVGIGAPLSSEGSTTADDVRDATAWVACGFEIIGTRFLHTPEPSGPIKIADSGANVACVSGDHCTDWQALDFSQLAVELFINEKSVAQGHTGMSIAGNPFGMAAWLANQPLLRERGLLPGDMIFCGTYTGALPVSPGDTLRAEIAELGTLTATVELMDNND